MQDPRIRLLNTLFLSFAAYSSVIGAALSLIWWVSFGKRSTSIRSLRALFFILILPALMGVMSSLSGEDGLSYFFRIGVVLIIASWMYAGRYPGEFLDVGVWLFGRKTGFDLGLIGELSVSALEELGSEIERVRIAIHQKGEELRPGILPSVFSALLIRQLRFAQDRAALLVNRGYMGGGIHCPVFHATWSEKVTVIFSLAILVISVTAGEFIILSGSIFIV